MVTLGLTYVIVANKQDLTGVMYPEDISHQFNIPEEVPILPTVATNKQGVYEAFEILVEVITATKEVKEFL